VGFSFSEPQEGQDMTAIVIDNIAIRQDEEGRFSLNDLHKASGGEPKHRPGEWLKSGPTSQLISEIESANVIAVSTVMGRNGGTYVCKELVYAYAMWISPQCHLKVIRAIPDREAVKTPEG